MTVRDHRVKAFCDWLNTVPPLPPFYTRPEFRFYADLTDAELDAAQTEMRRRGAAHSAEANAIEAARALSPRELTPEQHAVIEALAETAQEHNLDVMDAADMLVGAAALILMRSYAPKVAIDLLEHVMMAAREAVRGRMQ